MLKELINGTQRNSKLEHTAQHMIFDHSYARSSVDGYVGQIGRSHLIKGMANYAL